MRLPWLSMIALLLPLGVHAQVTAPIQNHCYLGGTQAKVSGLKSTNYQQGIIPSCTVTVFLTGTQTPATIFSDASGTTLSNPFTANTANSVDPGGWIFYAGINQGYDIVMSGGIPPNVYADPVTLTDMVAPSSVAGCPLAGCNFSGPISAPKMLTLDPWVDPRDPAFGASCANNSAIDDSAALTNALGVACVSGLEVQISGTCWVQNPVIWPTDGTVCNHGFGLRGASTGGAIKAATNFPDTGTAAALIYRQYTDTGPAAQVTLRDITLDANSTASACATFEAQRLLFLDKVTCLSATGNGGGELNFGRAAGGSGLVGLTARDIDIDNGSIIAAKGAAARPNYGLYMNNNSPDGHVENVVVNQNAIAGVYVNSGNNDFTKLHPFGFTALQKPAATWPQYGIYLDSHAFTNWFNATQCDTVETSCFYANKGFFTALNTDLECNDGGTGSLCGEFLVTAEVGAIRIHLYGGRLQAGSLNPTGEPVNWLGTPDRSGSDWLVEWPTGQLGFGTGNILTIIPTLQTPNIFQPNVTGILNETGGAINVSSSTINPQVLVDSTVTTAFPFYSLQNGTNQWLMQIGGSGGAYQLLDKSTNNLVVNIAEGASADSLDISSTGLITTAKQIRTHGLLQNANGNFANSCLMTSGACTAQTFTAAFNFTPVCTCTWSGSGTLTGAIKCPATTTTVTPASTVGTDTAQISWICVGQPN